MEQVTPKLRILIADDHQVWTEGLALSLEAYDLQPAGMVYSGDGVLDACQALRPDVLLLDIRLPGRNGLDVLKDVHDRMPDTTVLILTASSDPTLPQRAFELGAAGYVNKSASGEELAGQIKEARARHSAGDQSGSPPDWTALRKRPVNLTPTEVRVLILVARGLDNISIAQEMFVSENTVRTHVSRLLAKLGVPNRTLAVAWAFQHGITS